MVSILKAENAKVRHVLDAVKVCVLQKCNSESRFVGLSGGTIIEVNLSHPWGSNWHHDFSQKISVVIGGESGGVYSVADEAIVEVALSLVDVGLVVVTER